MIAALPDGKVQQMKRHASLLAGLLALAGCAPHQPELPPSAVSAPVAAEQPTADAAREAEIERALSDRDPEAASGHRLASEGSGFYVAAHRVLTNAHVVRECAAITVGNGAEGAETPAQLLAADPAVDLALLAVTVDGAPAAFAASLDGETGRGLSAVGYPVHGMVVRMAELTPVTARPDDLFADRPLFRFAGEVHPGNSGGPILDDGGAVLGVVVKKLDTVAYYRDTGHTAPDIGFAIANQTVLPFLAQHQVAYRTARASPSLNTAALLADAHGFVRQIGCWR